MSKRKYTFLLVFLIFLLVAVNYQFFDKGLAKFFNEREYVKIERIIDGDTIVVGGESIRLLGINSPEKGEKDYDKAGEFLEGLVLNKTVGLEISDEKDRYGRGLAFVFIGNTNINVEIVRTGLANVYILDNRKYKNQLRNAWEECIEKNVNLCEKSRNICAGCIGIEKFEGQVVIFKNKCSFDCVLDNWEIKDEGRKKFVFDDFVLEKNSEVKVIVGEGENSEDVLYWKGEDYVWTSSGDTLFLRDEEGGLVVWRAY